MPVVWPTLFLTLSETFRDFLYPATQVFSYYNDMTMSQDLKPNESYATIA